MLKLTHQWSASHSAPPPPHNQHLLQPMKSLPELLALVLHWSLRTHPRTLSQIPLIPFPIPLNPEQTSTNPTYPWHPPNHLSNHTSMVSSPLRSRGARCEREEGSNSETSARHHTSEPCVATRPVTCLIVSSVMSGSPAFMERPPGRFGLGLRVRLDAGSDRQGRACMSLCVKQNKRCSRREGSWSAGWKAAIGEKHICTR
jgi:hypothetical protein